jgi:hypothetical protein
MAKVNKTASRKAIKPAAKATAKPAKRSTVKPSKVAPAKATTSAKAATAAAKPAKAPAKVSGDGTVAKPWKLTTPPGSSAFIAYRDDTADPPALVCKVGSTTLSYQLRCIDDLHAMLKAHGDWMALGGTDEQKPAPDDTVEAWGRSAANPVGGWYGLKKGFRGRFGVYVPPVLEALGLAEVEHGARNNRMRAK